MRRSAKIEYDIEREFLTKSKELNHLIKQTQLDKDLILFRGIGIQEYYKIYHISGFDDPDLFYHRSAFLPSSTLLSEAIKFAGKSIPELGKTILCFKYNRGNEGIKIGPTYIGSINTILDEKELLLPMNSYLQVLDTETKLVEIKSQDVNITFIYCNLLYKEDKGFSQPILTGEIKNKRILELKSTVNKKYSEYMRNFDLIEWNKNPL
jgi:hypothetical protein